MIYADTSILAAYYCPELLSEAAQQALGSDPDRAVSDLSELELLSAVARKVRQREMRRDDGERIRVLFLSHLQARYYAQLRVVRSHYQLAQDWVFRSEVPLRSLDALHLAVAALENRTLLTADVAQARAARLFGVRVQLLES